ncbi:ERIC3 protein, partial [Malurus elegans]|nr:ERIC3 protein [Malurus elegans]
HQLPVMNPCVVPVPPPRLHGGDRRVAAVRGGQPTRRRFAPITAFNEQVLIKHTGGFPKSPLCSNALVTMVYIGKSGHVPLNDYWDDIQIYQQHCGGENLCVYKGKLFEGDTFQFTSKRHHGFPFSLTFFVNGMQADRLSCCCEYKQHRHSRLRGKHRYFRKNVIYPNSLFYRCILELGLDKKPSPPKRKREFQEEKVPESSWECAVHSEPSSNSIPFEQKSGQDSLSVILPAQEASEETVGETVETEEDDRKEE